MDLLFTMNLEALILYSSDNKVKILTRGSKEILPRTYSYLLSENLLDKKDSRYKWKASC